MSKDNLLRIIVWGIIAFILLVLSITGLFLFQSGHGKIGAVIKQTEPLVNTFNSLDGVKQFQSSGIKISAKAKGDKVVVSYNTEVSTASFTYTYQDDTGVRLLVMKYNTVDDTIASIITKYMIEAIAVSKGYPEGKVFEKFILSDFETTLPIDGVSIRTVDNVTTVILNMDTSILDSNIDTSTEEIKYITLEQAKKIVEGLTANSSVANKSDELTIHINMYQTYYSIYIRDNKEIYSKSMYETVKSFIEALSGADMVSEFTTICPEFNNINYDNDESKIMIMYDSVGASAYTEFPDSNKVLQIDVEHEITKTNNTEISSQ